MGFSGFHFSIISRFGSKCRERSGITVLTMASLLISSNLSSPLKEPSSSPRPSVLRRCTIGSYHILRGLRVETPFSLSSIRLMAYLVTMFPREALPLIRISAKLISHLSFFTLPAWRSITEITSASPLGLAEKYSTWESL